VAIVVDSDGDERYDDSNAYRSRERYSECCFDKQFDGDQRTDLHVGINMHNHCIATGRRKILPSSSVR
jgi:hypothetical protein